MGVSLGLWKEAETALEEIEPGSDDWDQVNDLIRHRSRNYHDKYKKRLIMRKLWRVKRTQMWESFEKDAEKYGNRKRLFHGTSPENAQNIIANGFKLPSRPGMFGKGIYFAKTPLKSVGYAKKASWSYGLWNSVTGWFYDADGPTGEYPAMLVCDVYIGRARRSAIARTRLNTASDIRPSCCARVFCCSRRKYDSIYAPGTPHRCHTLCCLCYVFCYAVRVSEYVVYDPCQGLPRYIVEFDTAGCEQELGPAKSIKSSKSRESSKSSEPLRLQAVTCGTPNCPRPPWNGSPGELCCRTCNTSMGLSHGPHCNQKWSEGVQEITQSSDGKCKNLPVPEAIGAV